MARNPIHKIARSLLPSQADSKKSNLSLYLLSLSALPSTLLLLCPSLPLSSSLSFHLLHCLSPLNLLELCCRQDTAAGHCLGPLKPLLFRDLWFVFLKGLKIIVYMVPCITKLKSQQWFCLLTAMCYRSAKGSHLPLFLRLMNDVHLPTLLPHLNHHCRIPNL